MTSVAVELSEEADLDLLTPKAPNFLASASMSSSSEVTTTLLFETRQSGADLIASSSKEDSPIFFKFFPGKDFEPPLAGITNKVW